MAIELVKTFFEQYGKAKDILEFEESSATVELAAQAAGVIPARIAKTISFFAEPGCILVVTAGDAKIDNAKFKAVYGKKAKMLTPEAVLHYTGHAVGGVCPFAIKNDEVKVYCDISLNRFSSVYPACGSSNSAIELSPKELFVYAQAIDWVDVCKDWDENMNFQ